MKIRGFTVRTGILAVALMALAAGIIGSSTGPLSAAGTATLSVTPSTQIVAPGASFNVTIEQNASVVTSGAQVDLTFDRTIFQVVDVQLGSDYAGGSQSVGESIPAGAPSFPNGFGASETGASCSNATDDDADGFVNDGCSNRGAAEVACGGSTDDDFDGRANDGCPAVGAVEKNQCGTDAIDDDGDGVTEINDGCPAVGVAEAGYQCSGTPGPLNSVDDDADGTVNDGCPARGGAEAESLCTSPLDDDGDGRVNDGCPGNGPIELGADCFDGVDDDSDGVINDGCETVGGAEQVVVCQGDLDEDGDLLVNDGCPTAGAAEAGASCANAIDDDADNRVNDGCPASGASETVPPCASGAGIDNDGDGLINDGCSQVNIGESGVACDNAIDDDGDEAINDGCPVNVTAEVQQCSDTIDNDADATVNDGCSAFGLPEVGGQCADATDDDGDGFVNDGCTRAGAGEVGAACANTVDNDGDLFVNDGCAEQDSGVVGACTDGVDSDGDLVIDDGCFPPDESGIACDNYLDDDGDGLINDGCTATEAAAIAKANTSTGVLVQPSSFFIPGTGSVATGPQEAIVIVMQANVVPCGATELKLTNGAMLDDLGDPVTVTLGAASYVGIDDGVGASDLDCDTVVDTTDNCDFSSNVGQENDDRNFINLAPDKAFNDTTWANADVPGNACDTDDDNDGRSDAAELAGTGCGLFTTPTNPLVRDTDGDRVLDGAECNLGFNPNDTASRPSAATCGDTSDADADGVILRNEVCFYNTNPAVANTDGDICNDGKEVASVNADNQVSAIDLSQVAQAFGVYAFGAPAFRYDFDMNKDGSITAIDLSFVAQRFGAC